MIAALSFADAGLQRVELAGRSVGMMLDNGLICEGSNGIASLEGASYGGMNVILSTLLLLALYSANSSSPPRCPSGATQVDAFTGDDGNAWLACEDLQLPGGAIVLLSSAGDTEWFAKTHEQYGSVAPGKDADYYLNLTKQAAVAAL